MSTPLRNPLTDIITPQVAKEQVDAYVGHVFDSHIARAGEIHAHYETLWQVINRLYAAGGKRLRPYLTLLMYQAYGDGSIEKALPAAAAQELLHQAMLIHDDIIDRDLIRYHIKNVSGQYDETYGYLVPDSRERRHFADSAALLAGDLLISEAAAQLGRLDVPADQLGDAQRILNEAIFHVVGGELLDTEASIRPTGDIDPLTINEQKTASYSFVGPLSMGAALAGAPTDQLQLLKHLGISVGIGYQLRDDIIGVFGDQTQTGKSTDGDLREGKRTLLIKEFYTRADAGQAKEFESLFGRQEASEQDIARMKELLIETGARDMIETYIEQYRQQTTEHLAGLAIDDAYRDVLTQLINKSLQREA